jgi:UDP-glucose 4-epimerase
MKILVTGGAGFIGSHIVQYYQGRADICVLDNLRSGFKANIAPYEHTFIEGSITDREIVKRAVDGVDYIFHLAAMISVPESMAKPVACVDINVNGTLTVLEEAAKAGVKKMVLSSSAAIYGDNPTVPKLESMLPEPKSPYAITKLDGEYYLKMFNDETNLKTASLRYFNVFGPRQDPQSQYAAAIPIFVAKALKNETITIHGDGAQTRDFIYVKDIARANAYMAENESHCGIYNVAYGNSQTVKALAEKILEITGSNSKIEYGPERAGDVKHSKAAIDNLSNTGFKSEGDFELGMEATVRYFETVNSDN